VGENVWRADLRARTGKTDHNIELAGHHEELARQERGQLLWPSEIYLVRNDRMVRDCDPPSLWREVEETATDDFGELHADYRKGIFPSGGKRSALFCAAFRRPCGVFKREFAQVNSCMINFGVGELRKAFFFRRLLSGTMLRLTYGHAVQSDDDSYMARIGRAAHLLALYPNPGAMPVDFFPFLRYLPEWFPGAAFIRHANFTREFVSELTDDLYQIVEDDESAGRTNTSLVAKWRGDSEKAKLLSREEIIDVKMNGFTTYLSGVETTEATILTFYLMMIMHPDVQHRAQAEVDQFVAAEGRLPSYEDRITLPFVGCVLKEVYRFGPPLPLAVPHATSKDDVYKNMFIPGGSLVIPNIWALMNDEKVFPKPDEFNPDRHMSKAATEINNQVGNLENGSENTAANDSSALVFGFGRRICPGKHFADAMVWQVMAKTLALFDVLPPLNKNTGQPELPEVGFITTATARPLPFNCRVVPRSERHLRLLQD